MESPPSVRCRNILLGSLSNREFEAFAAKADLVDIKLRDELLREHEPPEWAYFPEDGVVSMVHTLEDGSMIEVGVIGYDGLVAAHCISKDAVQPYLGIVQNGGRAWRIPMDVVRGMFQRSSAFQNVVLRYSSAFLLQVSQTAACNRVHTIEQRLGRWLLMMLDRTTTDELTLTQEFLSHMLGARIAGVNEAVQSLTLSGLVRHGRSRIEIIDRAGLEAAACECYAFVNHSASSNDGRRRRTRR